MPSTTPFNIFNEKKKPEGRGGSDELAVVKAAAWAWYQRSSGAEGKPMHEFDATKIRQAPRPSRYKLEATRTIAETTSQAARPSKYKLESMRTMDDGAADEGAQAPSPIHRVSSSLLDSYEVESISKQLDYLIESTSISNPFHEKVYVKDILQRQESWSSESSSSTISINKRRSKKFFKGFWGRPGIVCLTSKDVDAGALVSRRGRWPDRHAPVVKMATSRPRVAHA